MLQAFREHKRWLMVIAMVFIIPSFVVTGIYSYNRMTQSDNSIVKVGEVSITPENFDLAKRQQLERLRQQMGESFHASLLDTPQAREDLLRMLMDEAAINQVVAKNHISVSEAQAVALIKNADALKVDGKFSAERYEQFLRSQGKSDQQFVIEIRNDLAKEAVVSGVSATYPVPKALTEQFYEILTEERSVRTLVLPADDYLDKVAVTDEEIKDSGLAMFSEQRGLRSQFWNRVMFPIQDINHRVIGFGGRVMGDGEPKYLNSPETMIFDKRRNLYGLNFARTARTGNIILCEGYMDVIAMHQAGFTQAVASLGTAFTVEQANLLHRYAENILLAYDSDGAGTKAALRGIGILREAGLTGKVINMRPYKDPDEFIKNLGKEAFQERIDQAENSFYFEIRILSEQYDQSDPEQRTKFHREIAQKLCEFSEDLERENYLQAIAEKYMIRPDDLRKMVIGYASQTGIARPIPRPRSGVQNKSDPSESGRKSQRLLITWIGDDPSLYTIVPVSYTHLTLPTIA